MTIYKKTVLFFNTSDPSLHFLAAQGEIAKIKEEIDKGSIIPPLKKKKKK
jgi:hypothetical protein